MKEPEDLPGCTAIIDSIERRWSKVDQEIFLAAIVLNPFYRREPFAPTLPFNNASITALLSRVFKRVMKMDTIPITFYTELNNYLNLEGTFINLQLQLQIELNSAESMVVFLFILPNYQSTD